MIGRWVRRMLVVGSLGGAAWFVVRFLRGDVAPAFESGGPVPTLLPPRPAPAPAPAPAPVAVPAAPAPTAAPAPAPVAAPPVDPAPAPPADGSWIEAGAAAPVPGTHPVKAKLKSGIYHLPGMLNYDRTVPDRWYTSAETAEADGLRKAKR